MEPSCRLRLFPLSALRFLAQARDVHTPRRCGGDQARLPAVRPWRSHWPRQGAWMVHSQRLYKRPHDARKRGAPQRRPLVHGCQLNRNVLHSCEGTEPSVWESGAEHRPAARRAHADSQTAHEAYRDLRNGLPGEGLPAPCMARSRQKLPARRYAGNLIWAAQRGHGGRMGARCRISLAALICSERLRCC
jgi:hypothetical protein